jgi:hypothetical protein
MCYKAQRDTTEHKRLLSIQEWEVAVKEVGKKIVLKFPRNSFRKHFALASKSGTAQDKKIEHKSINRFMAGVPGKPLLKTENNRHQRTRNGFLKLYDNGFNENNTVIDLSVIGIDSVLTEICKEIISFEKEKAPTINSRHNIDLNFSMACVYKTSIVLEGEKPVYNAGLVRNSVTIGIEKNFDNPLTYSVVHVEAV